MSTLFRNVQQTVNYAKFRPTYPASLYDFLLGQLSCDPTTAVDVGCGTGQATFELAKRFEQVIGIDPSAEQLAQIDASASPNVTFQVNDSVNGLSGLKNSSVACITAAQAAHWFDLPLFYKECQRVLQPGGILALWTYSLLEFEDQILEKQVNQVLYEDILGTYWDPRREYVDKKYASLPKLEASGFTTERIEGQFGISVEVSPAELVGFLRSWSGYNSYCQQHGVQPGAAEDPVHQVEQLIEKEGVKTVKGHWPVTVLLSRKNPEEP